SKPTRIERLDKVEKEARAIQEFKRHKQQKLKHYIDTLLLYSIVIYVICAIFCYIFYFPDNWSDRFLYLLPFVAFPFLIYGWKRFLHWRYVRRITEKEIRLVELRDEKRQLLEEVMESDGVSRFVSAEIAERMSVTL
ncbi:PREDICTED: protein lunapark-B-like, partial [Priapulus caudatus]|uniref:Protein lunapark-B-like n=1 Tax=Priapulus caudatus TaxID=37621 RepID=A0ABM1ENL1_PRICU